MEEINCWQVKGTFVEFAWRDLGKPGGTLVRIVGDHAKIRSGYLLLSSQKLYLLSQLAQ
jgi:hypothetical protein